MLWKAIGCRDTSKVFELLKKGADPNCLVVSYYKDNISCMYCITIKIIPELNY